MRNPEGPLRSQVFSASWPRWHEPALIHVLRRLAAGRGISRGGVRREALKRGAAGGHFHSGIKPPQQGYAKIGLGGEWCWLTSFTRKRRWLMS